jgi:periplasmic divalent cation tolerance protein
MIIVYTTCPTEKEAERISMSLLGKRLAGCCNIFPVKSAYLWKGKIEKAREYAIIIKTSERNFPVVEKEIKRLHSYEVPCIEGWDVSRAEKAYAAWFDTELSSGSSRKAAKKKKKN